MKSATELALENSLFESGFDDQTTRGVWLDFLAERGQGPSGVRQFLWAAYANAYADADADDDTAAAAYAAADADADDDTAYAADAAADTADADTAAAAAAVTMKDERNFTAILQEDVEMRDGLTLIQIPGRYGYGVTLVGWAKHVHGDWFDLHNAVSVVRTSGQRTLGQLAADGPMRDHHVNDTAEDETPEQIHSWRVRRVRAASVEAWSKWSPKPKGWDESNGR